MNGISITYKLYVMPGNMIVVPGCEPQSTITTPRMAYEQFCNPDGTPTLPPAADTPYGKITDIIANPYTDPSKRCVCKASIISVWDALEAIPGSRIVFMDNFGTLGTTQKLFELPPITPECPCQSYDDYYKILRDLGREATEDEIEEMMINNCYDGGWKS